MIFILMNVEIDFLQDLNQVRLFFPRAIRILFFTYKRLAEKHCFELNKYCSISKLFIQKTID